MPRRTSSRLVAGVEAPSARGLRATRRTPAGAQARAENVDQIGRLLGRVARWDADQVLPLAAFALGERPHPLGPPIREFGGTDGVGGSRPPRALVFTNSSSRRP